LYCTTSGIITLIGGRPVHRLRDARSAKYKKKYILLFQQVNGQEPEIYSLFKFRCYVQNVSFGACRQEFIFCKYGY